jgi:plasmid maintenance system antidote protein VapI
MIAVDMKETAYMAELFREFVGVVFDGNQSRAAEALEVDKSTVSRICNGDRRVSVALAQRVETVSEGRYRKEAFIWPEAA